MTLGLRENASQLFELGPRIARMIRRSMIEKGVGDLTLPQYRILTNVAQGIGKASVLCELKGVSMPAMSRMVDTLVRKGFLKRGSNSEDRREIVLSLTPEGKKALEQLKGAVTEAISGLLGALSRQEQEISAQALGIFEKIFP